MIVKQGWSFEVIDTNVKSGNSFYALLLLASFLCAVLLTRAQTVPECERIEGKQTTTIEGSVCSGQKFSKAFGNRFEFKLVPAQKGWGWELKVIDTRDNFDIAVLTPPLHAPNPLDLYGWHFRNKDNTGPNTGEVNAPQKVRHFRFSRRCAV